MVSNASPKLGGEEEGPKSGEEILPRPFGKYILLRKVASGGMAELFIALHKSVGGFEKLIVIKRILPQMNQDAAFIEMLVHEARVAANFTHPNIAQTFDVGKVDDTYFIAMERVEGEDIRSIVRQMRTKNVVEFPVQHAISIVLGVAAGLAYAHERRDASGGLLNVVHRDISPQNIVVTYAGDVKIVDFGIAKSQQMAEEAGSGQLKGKVPYMSPEQARAEDIDWRTDIFALGVILFELTTGRRLFKGATEHETLRLIKDEPYPLPTKVVPGYPAALEPIVMRALAKRREERYQSARELKADLETYVRDERVHVSAVGLESWMQMLFRERIAQLNVEISDAKARADTIAAFMPQPDSSPFSSGMTGLFPAVDMTTLSSVPSTGGGSGAGAAVASIPPAKKSSALGVVVGGAVVLALAAGGVFAYVKATSPAATPSASAALPPPTASEVVDAKGAIKITSTPPGAAIWINGDLRDEVTPATIANLPIGRALKLKLSKDGLESYKEDVTIDKAGDTKAVDATMKTGSVTVTLDITPPPLGVWVDGKQWKGALDKIDSLSAEEEHRILVSSPGYLPQTFAVNQKMGETKAIKAMLVRGDPAAIAKALEDAKKNAATSTAPSDTSKTAEPSATGPGTVRINSKGGWCSATVNGAGAGATPTQVSVSAGTVRVTCKPESGAAQSQAVTVEPGKTAYVTFVFN